MKHLIYQDTAAEAQFQDHITKLQNALQRVLTELDATGAGPLTFACMVDLANNPESFVRGKLADAQDLTGLKGISLNRSKLAELLEIPDLRALTNALQHYTAIHRQAPHIQPELFLTIKAGKVLVNQTAVAQQLSNFAVYATTEDEKKGADLYLALIKSMNDLSTHLMQRGNTGLFQLHQSSFCQWNGEAITINPGFLPNVL